jgi:hypothetical protein
MEYNKSRVDMPKKRVIFSHWKDTLLKKHNRDINNKYTCFACLRDGFVERCHIEPLVTGGCNSVANLHILCPNCHKESEGYSGRFYWIWFSNKDIVMIPVFRSREQSNIVSKIIEIIKVEIPEIYKNAINKNLNTKEILKMYNSFIETTKGEHRTKQQTQKKLFK